MKKLAIVLTTVMLVFTATGCENWGSSSGTCCKKKCCKQTSRSCYCKSNGNGNSCCKKGR